ncbi:DNA glycosylase superfamily protein [Raphanus sativus]|nr:DNA glycosylase superfamily protein [Raphanus sativus]
MKTLNGFGSNLNTVKEQALDDNDSVFESHDRHECSESLSHVRRVSPYFQHKQGCHSDSVSSKTQSTRIGCSKAKVKRVSPYFQASTSSQCDSDNIIASQSGIKPRKKCSKAQPKVRKVSPYVQGSTVQKQPRDMRQYFKVVKVSRYFHGPSAQVNESQKEISRRVRKTPLVSPSLSQSQKTDEAYLRKTPDNTWVPPRSPCNLLQEDHWHDPWRVLVICMLLNKTSGAQTRGVIPDLFALSPKTATKVEEKEIETLIKPLGLQKKRAKMIQRFSL